MFLTYHLEVFMAYILTFYLAFSLAWALPDLNRERQISVALRSGARS
jgi:membrane-anchored glycerophosphoryl diester phosphodiesterase (GDPDase)